MWYVVVLLLGFMLGKLRITYTPKRTAEEQRLFEALMDGSMHLGGTLPTIYPQQQIMPNNNHPEIMTDKQYEFCKDQANKLAKILMDMDAK